MKKILLLLAVVLVAVGLWMSRTGKEPLSQMSPEACLAFLEEHNVQVPEELLEEGFDVQKLLSQLEADPDMAYVLGDTQFSQFVEGARAAVQQDLADK